MMKTKLNFVSSIARNVRHFSALNVKSILRPINPYQQFDHHNNSSLQEPSFYMKISHYFHNRPNMHRKFSQLKITPTIPCWHCDHRLESIANGINSIFCDKCGVLRTTNKDDDFFAIMGMPKQFLLDTSELTAKFRKLQGVVHPDKFSNKSAVEQDLSADWSSLINSAYKTLLAPIKRGEYLLKLHGAEIPEDNNTVDRDFLLKMMERNEEVDDANEAGELKKLLENVRQDLQKAIIELETSLRVKDLEKSKLIVISLRYLISLENSIKTKNARLGFVD